MAQRSGAHAPFDTVVPGARVAPTDPIDQFLGRSNSKAEAAALLDQLNPSPPAVATVDTLKSLTRALAWGTVIDATGSILYGSQTLDEATRLEVMSFRIAALLQTGQVDRAAEQISWLADDFRRYPLEGSAGDIGDNTTVVPFELEALAADVASRKSSPRALESFYELRTIAKRQVQASRDRGDEDGVKRWHAREQVMLSSLTAHHLRLQQNDAAVDLAREMVRENPGSGDHGFILVRLLIYSSQFETAKAVLAKVAEMPSVTTVEVHLHRGMLLSAKGFFDEALDEFEATLLLDPSSLPAANNAALCLLQMGRLAEAIDKLEDTLRSDPVRALDEGLVFNLCTLYDLSQPDKAKDKKVVLRKLAARFGRQGFNMDSIKI